MTLKERFCPQVPSVTVKDYSYNNRLHKKKDSYWVFPENTENCALHSFQYLKTGLGKDPRTTVTSTTTEVLSHLNALTEPVIVLQSYREGQGIMSGLYDGPD